MKPTAPKLTEIFKIQDKKLCLYKSLFGQNMSLRFDAVRNLGMLTNRECHLSPENMIEVGHKKKSQ
jgi:hypothetical protein